MASLPQPPKQSWPSAAVDLGIIAAIIAFAVMKVEPMTWLVLTQIAFVRFGVATIKARNESGSDGGGTGSSGQMRQVHLPPETERRPDDTFPRARMSPALIPSLAISIAVMLSAAISLAAR